MWIKNCTIVVGQGGLDFELFCMRLQSMIIFIMDVSADSVLQYNIEFGITTTENRKWLSLVLTKY